jgi:cell wall-associated NlpC family hydrolase
MYFRKNLCVALCLSAVMSFSMAVSAQTRSRIVTTSDSRPTTSQQKTPEVRRTVLASPTTSSRPTMNNQVIVVGQQPSQVQKTASTTPATSMLNTRLAYPQDLNSRLMSAIQAKIGIPYLYGSNGPNRYDCSSFVWKVFQDAGIHFTRTSARVFWNQFEPVYGEDRFKFGTLVFFNKLGHVGIVADDKGFYQASSSKGITYSKFAGYWEKRIVGYRRVPVNYGMY